VDGWTPLVRLRLAGEGKEDYAKCRAGTPKFIVLCRNRVKTSHKYSRTRVVSIDFSVEIPKNYDFTIESQKTTTFF
jgi:hypothetical protein